MSDVIDMETEKEKRKNKGGKEDAPSKAEICYRAAAAMVGKRLDWDPFPERFELIKPPSNAPYYVWIREDGECESMLAQPVTELEIQSIILHYFSVNKKTAGASMSPADCETTFKFWQLLALKKPFPEDSIMPVRFKSQPGITWRRLEFDPDPRGTPTWDELMSRVTTPEVVMAFIGSLFVPEANREQWLCLHGQGRNGKSRIASLLAKCLANGAQSVTPPRGPFWNAQLLGRRLITFADCGDLKFLGTPNFKNLTGADRVPIERKGKDIFDAAICCKFLIISNEKPEIRNTVSEKRRALYAEVAAFDGQEMNPEIYDQLMWSEAPGILYKCLEWYKKLCPQHSAIPFSSEAFDDLIVQGEEELEFRARRWLKLWPPGSHDGKPYCDRPFVKPGYLMRIKKYERLSDGQYKEFKEFLERAYGIHHRRVKVDGSKVYRYLNCEENPERPRDPNEAMMGPENAE